jgi:hypothetical protein
VHKESQRGTAKQQRFHFPLTPFILPTDVAKKSQRLFSCFITDHGFRCRVFPLEIVEYHIIVPSLKGIIFESNSRNYV